jgi:hypothetical protein
MKQTYIILENNQGDIIQLFKENGIVKAFEKVGNFRKLSREFSEGKTIDDVIAIYGCYGYKSNGIEIF